ncbi:putative protein YjcH [Geobacillus thermodenitrificans]|jgi:predicted alpha/beta superfamily hydrolase|nr:putative protein YjcH [Geobacillus thermodenitrificans]KQB94819.1 putative protein YbbA [Geobacillus sp. PA-3]
MLKEGHIRGTLATESWRGRKLLIYLPPSYVKGASRYPVVYVQDGGYLFDPSQSDALVQIELMFARGELPELLFVGIETKNRLDEYTPWHAKALSERFADFGGKGSHYLAFLVEELKPYIDASYQPDGHQQQTGLIGASLGGLISMYAAYLYPHVFGKIGCLSGSFWYEGFLHFMESHIVAPEVKIYMDVGSIEGIEKQNVQREMVSRTKAAYAILMNQQRNNKRLKLVIEEGTPHARPFFIRRFPNAVKWLYSDTSRKS